MLIFLGEAILATPNQMHGSRLQLEARPCKAQGSYLHSHRAKEFITGNRITELYKKIY